MSKKNIFIILISILALSLTAQPYLGIFSGNCTKDSEHDYGIQIYKVIENSPAQDAGFQKSDIILKMDGDKIYTQDQFIKMLKLKEIGNKVKFNINREGKNKKINVVLGDKRKFGKPYLGIIPGNISDEKAIKLGYEKNYGILVKKSIDSQAAFNAGIRDDTIIMQIEGDKVYTLDQLIKMLNNYKVDQEISIKCFIEKNEKEFTVKLGANLEHDPIGFFNLPTNVFMYQFGDEDSIGKKHIEIFFDDKQFELPNLEDLGKKFKGFEEIFQLKRFGKELKDIDLKELKNMEIIINDKTITLPDNIDELSEEDIREFIKKQFGDNNEVEIKIIKTSKKEDVNIDE